MNQKEWLSDILETATEKQREAIYKVLAASDEQCKTVLHKIGEYDHEHSSRNAGQF